MSISKEMWSLFKSIRTVEGLRGAVSGVISECKSELSAELEALQRAVELDVKDAGRDELEYERGRLAGVRQCVQIARRQERDA